MSDLLLVHRDLPPAGTPWREATGAELAAQDISEELLSPYGSLPWDETAGSYLDLWRNDVVTPAQVVAELERVALRNQSVLPQSVVGSYDRDSDTYRLSFVGPDYRRITLRAVPLPQRDPVPPPEPERDHRLLLIGPQRYLLLAPGVRLRV